MRDVMNVIEKWLAWICATLMALMVVDVTWQVVSRFILSNPSSFSEELARFLLIWIGFLGAAYAYRRHAHLGLDILTANLTGVKKILAEKFADTVSLCFAAVIMVFAGTKIMLLTLELNQISVANFYLSALRVFVVVLVYFKACCLPFYIAHIVSKLTITKSIARCHGVTIGIHWGALDVAFYG